MYVISRVLCRHPFPIDKNKFLELLLHISSPISLLLHFKKHIPVCFRERNLPKSMLGLRRTHAPLPGRISVLHGSSDRDKILLKIYILPFQTNHFTSTHARLQYEEILGIIAGSFSLFHKFLLLVNGKHLCLLFNRFGELHRLGDGVLQDNGIFDSGIKHII